MQREDHARRGGIPRPGHGRGPPTHRHQPGDRPPARVQLAPGLTEAVDSRGFRRELERRAKHKLAVLPHVEDVNVTSPRPAATTASADEDRPAGDREDPLAAAAPLRAAENRHRRPHSSPDSAHLPPERPADSDRVHRSRPVETAVPGRAGPDLAARGSAPRSTGTFQHLLDNGIGHVRIRPHTPTRTAKPSAPTALTPTRRRRQPLRRAPPTVGGPT